jgi:ABC-2 type transport system permease protein
VRLYFLVVWGEALQLSLQRENKRRLFISPLSGTSYFLGIFLAHSFIGISQAILVYAIATFIGAQFEGSIALGLLVIALSIAAYVGVGFILGTQLARRTEDVNALVATFGVPLLILGGAFLPTSLFPENLLEIAEYNPIYHMNEALVAIWAEGEDLAQIDSHFWFLTFFAIATVILGWLSYRSMLAIERRL